MLAAFPFLASGVAQAAMAGGNPLTTTNRPDLRTVHVNNGADTAEFCFDKAIANVSPGLSLIDPDNFSLGGYRFDVKLRAVTANVESSNTNCVVATMDNSTGADLTSYSYGTVDDNAVSANNGGANAPGNIGDSTANLDSTSHNGTADHTQGPDLQAVIPDVTNNRMNYVFDQPIDSASLTPGNNTFNNLRFLFYDTNGGPHWGWAIGSSGTVVSVQFSPFPGDAVSNAVQAVVIRGLSDTEGQPQGIKNNCFTTGGNPLLIGLGAVCEAGGKPETIAPTESVAVPGTSGLTARPVLLSANLVSPIGQGSNQIDYTFSVPITAVDGDPGNLVAVMSNGQEVSATGETVIGPNTVRATFATLPNGLETYQELVVKASAYGCTTQFLPFGLQDNQYARNDCTARRVNNEGGAGAVSSVNPSSGAVTRFNETGGVAVGDNAGAFATGFSTGPDARWVTFDNSTGTVTVQLDQRVDPGTVDRTLRCGFGHVTSNGCFVLLSNTGTTITDHPNSAAVVSNSPFQSQIVLTYSPTDVQRSVALAIAGAPVDPISAAYTFSGDFQFSHQGTVRQVISPTASATAFLDPAKSKSKSKAHKAKKHHRKAKAHR